MFCENCGKQLSDTAKFCSACGTPQRVAPTPAQPQPTPAQSQPAPAQPQPAIIQPQPAPAQPQQPQYQPPSVQQPVYQQPPQQTQYQQPPAQQPIYQQPLHLPQYQQPQAGGVYDPPGVMVIEPNNSFQFMWGEVLFASHYGARFNPVSSAGYMHVTNMRVVWTKSLGASMLSHGIILGAALADQAEIPLGEVVGVDGGRVRGSKGGITIHTRDGKKHLYAVTSKGGTCNAGASASKDIMMAVLNYAVSVNRG